jgi:tRNA A-37 threonylcarbamoyl transferase component Bud32
MASAFDSMELIARSATDEVFRRGGETVKVFDESVCAADVLGEALNLARAEETGLPVPRLREVTKLEGKWAIISAFLEGETLAYYMETQPERMAEWLELFVTLQLRVHEKRSPLLGRLRDVLRRGMEASGLDATTRYELRRRLDETPRHNKLCHGDFVPSNILLIHGEPCLIDWADVTQGNASADAAGTYLSFLREGKENLARQYLKRYCERSDTARQYVISWLPLLAAAKLAGCAEEDRAFYLGFCELEME